MIFLNVSQRASDDLLKIERFSEEQWGEVVAQKYLDSIEDALLLVKESPQLLRSKPEISKHFKFYRVRQHFLIFALFQESIYLLAIKHASMNLPERICELESQLLTEAELLHQAFERQRSRKPEL